MSLTKQITPAVAAVPCGGGLLSYLAFALLPPIVLRLLLSGNG